MKASQWADGVFPSDDQMERAAAEMAGNLGLVDDRSPWHVLVPAVFAEMARGIALTDTQAYAFLTPELWLSAHTLWVADLLRETLATIDDRNDIGTYMELTLDVARHHLEQGYLETCQREIGAVQTWCAVRLCDHRDSTGLGTDQT